MEWSWRYWFMTYLSFLFFWAIMIDLVLLTFLMKSHYLLPNAVSFLMGGRDGSIWKWYRFEWLSPTT